MSRLSFSLPFTGVSSKRRIQFYTQLEQMLDAGIPPVRSLRAIGKHINPRRLRRIVNDMAEHIESGGSLTSAFERHPAVFSPLERRIIGASETGGFSSQAISGMVRFQTDMRRLWVQFWTNMIYPGMIIFTAAVVCPLLKAIFLGGVENLLERLGWNALLGFLCVFWIVLIFRFLNSRKFSRRILHRFALHLPLFGRVFRKLAKVRFAKTLASLYSAGLPVREAYRESALASGNETIARRLLATLPVLNEGGTLSQAIELSRQFDPIALGMIVTGEESGQMDTLLNKYAAFEEAEAVNQLKIVSRAIPTLVYLLVMAYVAYFIIGAYKSYFAQLDLIQ